MCDDEEDAPSDLSVERQDVVPPAISYATFLEEHPPGSLARIANLGFKPQQSASVALAMPLLQLHCPSEQCNGIRIFGSSDTHWLREMNQTRLFQIYRCRNCGRHSKTYALLVKLVKEVEGVAQKIGEVPPYGPPVPARAISLIGPDRELFLSGRRAENQGLGIGSFAYYRRVVENQKDRLLDEIIRVAEKTGSRREVIERLQAAKNETQFTKAIGDVAPAVPEGLLIDGHNPLTVLHRALSAGLHAQSDEECLDAAESIRLVLYELAERSSRALQTQDDLKRAVGRLMNPPAKSP